MISRRTVSLRFFNLSVSLFLLSILDALFTDVGLRKEVIAEGNPLMSWLYYESVLFFYLLKISLPLLLIFLSLRLSHMRRSIKAGMIATTVLYSFVFMYHIYWACLTFQ